MEGEELNLLVLVPLLPLALSIRSNGFRLLGRDAYPSLHSCTTSTKPLQLLIIVTSFLRIK